MSSDHNARPIIIEERAHAFVTSEREEEEAHNKHHSVSRGEERQNPQGARAPVCIWERERALIVAYSPHLFTFLPTPQHTHTRKGARSKKKKRKKGASLLFFFSSSGSCLFTHSSCSLPPTPPSLSLSRSFHTTNTRTHARAQQRECD